MFHNTSPRGPRSASVHSRTSALLWGHLLSKGNPADAASQSDAPPSGRGDASSVPRAVPTDKAGTTMRILLHDTQANLEHFSERVTTLTSGIDEAKQEIVAVQKLFEQDHETITADMVDLGAYKVHISTSRSLLICAL